MIVISLLAYLPYWSSDRQMHGGISAPLKIQTDRSGLLAASGKLIEQNVLFYSNTTHCYHHNCSRYVVIYDAEWSIDRKIWEEEDWYVSSFSTWTPNTQKIFEQLRFDSDWRYFYVATT